jgi:peptide/nickel transport system substrate-binding protein
MITPLPRRATLGLGLAAALPRFAIAQADTRPTITIAVQKVSITNALDLLREQSNVGTRLSAFFTERLIGLNYQSALEQVPGLATEWRRIDDKTVEFKLRRGVKFHNGDELTAEDVAFSFGPEHMMGSTRPTVDGKTLPLSSVFQIINKSKELPPEVPPVARRLFPGLDRVEVVDRYTVRFINATPDVTIEGRVSSTGAEIVSQRAFNESPSWLDYSRQPVGTGPYKVRSLVPDSMLILDAHDEYWGGRPPIKTIRLVEVPEVASRINGLLAGEYQFICDMPPDQITTIEKNAGFEVLGGTIPNHRILAFDDHNVLANPKLRLAMAHAIDRQAIVDSLWAGRTVVPKGLQWDFYADMLITDWRCPDYNLATVKDLLKQAGYKGDRIEFRLQNNYYTNQTATGQVLTEMWQQAGINVEIVMKENWSQVFERTPSRAVRDWSNSATFNDPVSSIVAQHGPNGEQQQRGEWTNEEMNQLSVVLLGSTDRALRKKAFARMLMICEREDPAYTVLHQNATFTAKPKKIRWKAAPTFAMDFRATNFG